MPRSYGGIGRRDRLKIYFSKESIGSTPITSTNFIKNLNYYSLSFYMIKIIKCFILNLNFVIITLGGLYARNI